MVQREAKHYGWSWGLEKVFQEEFSGAKTQRCQVHVARNVLAKVTKKHPKEVADDLRSFLCILGEKAVTFYDKFRNDWQKEFPSAVKSLEEFHRFVSYFLFVSCGKSGYH